MTQPYIGEVRMFSGNFAPVDWLFCNGQSISISSNPALFQLIGTTYGGDGVQNFNLPNLQSRVPIHASPTSPIGTSGGAEQVTLTGSQIPPHNHDLNASTSSGAAGTPTGNVLSQSSSAVYRAGTTATAHLSGLSVGPSGGNAPHPNIQPYLCINFIIATAGIYPTQG